MAAHVQANVIPKLNTIDRLKLIVSLQTHECLALLRLQ